MDGRRGCYRPGGGRYPSLDRKGPARACSSCSANSISYAVERVDQRMSKVPPTPLGLSAPETPGRKRMHPLVIVAIVVAAGLGLIVVLGIVAAVALPALLRARMAGNEASAIGSLRMISSAQAVYSSDCGAGSLRAVARVAGAAECGEAGKHAVPERGSRALRAGGEDGLHVSPDGDAGREHGGVVQRRAGRPGRARLGRRRGADQPRCVGAPVFRGRHQWHGLRKPIAHRAFGRSDAPSAG